MEVTDFANRLSSSMHSGKPCCRPAVWEQRESDMLPCLCSLLKPFGDADMAIDVVEFDSNWEKLSGAQFTMQHSFFNPHDFAVTPSNYLFFQVT